MAIYVAAIGTAPGRPISSSLWSHLPCSVSLCGVAAVWAAAREQPAGVPCKYAEWWKSVQDLIEFPCSASSPVRAGIRRNSRNSALGHGYYTDQDWNKGAYMDNGTKTRLARSKRKRGCLPLERSAVFPPTREGRDIAARLLESIGRWVRGPLSDVAKELRCNLKLSVDIPLANRKDLTKAQRKVAVDLIMLASYTRYLEQVVTTIDERKKKMRHVPQQMRALSNKLKVIACNLRQAVDKLLLPHVTANHVPPDLRLHDVDLRHVYRRRVATYVIVEKVEQFLRNLPGSYRRNGLNIC